MNATPDIASISVIPATIHHLDDIVNIEQNSFLSPWDRQALAHEISALRWSRTRIAVCDDVLVGYICFWKVADEYQILKVAVHPEFRRQQIGARMIAHVMTLAKQERITSISLELRESNAAAQALYTGCGFVTDGIRKRYYTDTGEDAILMSYQIR